MKTNQIIRKKKDKIIYFTIVTRFKLFSPESYNMKLNRKTNLFKLKYLTFFLLNILNLNVIKIFFLYIYRP